MKDIYLKNEEGRKSYIKVSDDVEKIYSELRKQEWRRNSYERYHTVSLDAMMEAGHEFMDEERNAESEMIFLEEQKERRLLLKKLKKVVSCLTPLQRETLRKIFVLNMSQAEIAREEGVARATVKERIEGAFSKIRKLLKKF